ncbi:MAG: thermonuclease family protein [Rhodospirillaceae bacterium]
MRGWAIIVAALALALMPAAGGRAAAGDAVQAVPDGQTLAMADGATVRLAAIAVPGVDATPRGADARLAEAARRRIAALAAAGPGTRAAARAVRGGRGVAQVTAADGTWLQRALVGDGLARVAPTPDDGPAVPGLYAAEAAARAARRGLWAVEFYRVRTPAEAGGLLDRFAVVEGTVREAKTVSGRALLFFADGGGRGFTVTIAPASMKRFRGAGLAPARYAGRTVRVRGWVGEFRGPQIEVTHPAQIEVLDP